MGLPWVYGLFLSLMGGKMGLQKAILEGKLAPSHCSKWKKARAAVRRRNIYYCGNDTSTHFFYGECGGGTAAEYRIDGRKQRPCNTSAERIWPLRVQGCAPVHPVRRTKATACHRLRRLFRPCRQLHRDGRALVRAFLHPNGAAVEVGDLPYQ